MLQEAAVRARAGVDVVVALVETHGRAETEALMSGLDVLPRRRLLYRGQELDELDLDALLARRPQLALDGCATGPPTPRVLRASAGGCWCASIGTCKPRTKRSDGGCDASAFVWAWRKRTWLRR